MQGELRVAPFRFISAVSFQVGVWEQSRFTDLFHTQAGEMKQ